ncbi:hypothetical protein EDF57_107216 [Novosphingobium sp. PhB55]|uniref:DUF6998 domain-containing protein n=1 Tax=Novosphingobium sp. PhB55 TaxID=2485106 RepID=UPI001066571C|nr:hypothetical protein [Novosphingobium sp. PhB55]TDW62818.1 hypothetical protein EDF57_107216 [Novosphingobium sp. PhB55]
MAEVDWAEVRTLLDSLYGSAERLEALFPGRKFTLDGHLVCSIGEVIAAYMFDLPLDPASTMVHDALCPAGRRVEIKFTQGRTVAGPPPAPHKATASGPSASHTSPA